MLDYGRLKSDKVFDTFEQASDRAFVYMTDMRTGLSRWSQKCIEYFGMRSAYMEDAAGEWLGKVHPNDKDIYLQDIEAVFSGVKNKHNCRYRALNRFGKYVWLECRGTMLYDDQGNPDIFAGMMMRLDTQSTVDPLTGLMSKTVFYDTDYDDKSGYVILAGLDGFGKIIKSFSYSFGDEVLVYVAKKLAETSADNEDLFRFNGDEFLIVLKGGSKEQCMARIEEIGEILSKIKMGSIILNLSSSFGLIAFDDYMKGKAEKINQLELALRHAKRSGKGECAWYEDKLLREGRRRSAIEQGLKQSIENDFSGFELYFQPQIRAEDQMVTGCEALLRWKNDKIKGAGPAEFVPILEDNGDINRVGNWVFRTAVKKQKQLQEKYKDFKMSINISYGQMLEEGFAEELIGIAVEEGVDPHNIVVELTESCEVDDPETVSKVFERLKSAGFILALDDFGAGYSSMELLRAIPCDTIKIQHTFVKDIAKNDNEIDFAIVESLLTLGLLSRKYVVIEGIENATVDRMIRNMDLDVLLQGYYYSRPLSEADFDLYLSEAI